jgi:hypothetical protein
MAVVVAATVAGCSGDDSGDGGDAAGLHATLQQSTLFETQHALRLVVGNDSDRDVELATIQLRSPLFEPVEPERRDTRLDAGSAGLSMPLPFGDARCRDDVTEGPAELVTEVDGEAVQVALDESPSDLLASMHAEECAAAAILADVDLAFGDQWEHTAPRTVTGQIELAQRHSGVSASVDEVGANMIFTVSPVNPVGAGNPWLEVGDGEPSSSLAVTIQATRCDEHAIAEYKRKYLFVALVRIGDDEPVRVDVEADGETQQALEGLIQECLE